MKKLKIIKLLSFIEVILGILIFCVSMYDNFLIGYIIMKVVSLILIMDGSFTLIFFSKKKDKYN